MEKKNTKATNLVMQTLSDIPMANADAKEIVALMKQDGAVSGYKLSDGTVLSKKEATETAKKGGIKDVAIGINKGTEYLKSIPDGSISNNLSNLPTISQ